MAIIVEDGSIVANANSYVTDGEFQTYAFERGLTIAAATLDRTALLLMATDWLSGMNYQGLYVDADNQYLPFPRSNVYAYGRIIDSTSIPRELKYAQMEAAIAAFTTDLLINQSSGNITKVKLDVMETEYAAGGIWTKVRVGRAMNYLKPFLGPTDKLVRT